MTVDISVNLSSATPPYEQIRVQISSLIALGALESGTRLPAVRGLAADLGLAAGTVARAYKELEQAGLIETRRRNGTVVVGMPAVSAPGSVETAETVTAAVEHYIAEGRKAGLANDTLLRLLAERLGERQ
ncbi:GntR family transcriptional regulator [Arthrobacter sp.]|uniref:GntR family transcriptional regulator n=1 Tax=Arthrobacter sp. TaxID=1667 RepID=UPI00281109D1|nr:GntR family transcriptional regulator [Arthrobacter sp.]